MIRRLLGSLRRALSSRDADGQTDDEAEEDAEQSGFLRSRLDATVLTSHGDGNPEGERELADVQEDAQRLQEERRRG